MDPDHPDRPTALGSLGEADGVPIKVVELTGASGDLWLMDAEGRGVMMTWRFLRER